MERKKKTRRSDASATSPGPVQSATMPLCDSAPVVSNVPQQKAGTICKDDDGFDDSSDSSLPELPRDVPLTVKISRQLHLKLMRSAQEEGVNLEALVQELLAEGATLRAWEIIERKQAMRSGGAATAGGQHAAGNRPFNAPYQNGNGNSRHANGNRPVGAGNGARHNHNRSGGNGRGQMNPNAWMEDKAAFLEYVRNQEKQRRR